MSIWHKAGTIAVTNGSGVVTGTGTGWNGKVQVGDAIHMPDGRVYEVVTITSDTVIGIAPNYLGSTATGQAYRIQPTRGVLASYLATVQAWMASQQGFIDGALAGRFGDGTTALPGLAFAADLDTGMRRKGNNTLALVTGGVDRFEVNNAGAILTGLLTGTAVTQSASDNTSGRLLKFGDFGIGHAITLTAAMNLNDIAVSGQYVNATGGNTPGNNYPVSSAGVLLHVSSNTNNLASQIYALYGSGAVYTRSKGAGGAWSAWIRLDVERGSNANGDYARFGDGTMICTRTADLGSILANGSGTLAQPYYTNPATLSFAAAFSAAPTPSFAFPTVSGIGIPDRVLVPAGYDIGVGSITSFRVARIGGTAIAANVTCTITAIGRWF